MRTNTLPYPRQMEQHLAGVVPVADGDYNHINIIPRDEDGRKSAAWCAAYYEVKVCPVATGGDLAPIEMALSRYPGSFRTTRIDWYGEPETLYRHSTRVYKIADPDWPTALRANDVYTRPMVVALIADPSPEAE